MNDYYIVLDGEMGGIGLQYSLLEICFHIIDSKFKIKSKLVLKLKPNDGIYHVCGEALEVNRINLSTHDKGAVTYKKGGTMLYDFLNKNSNGGKIKLIPVGHGMSGDLDQIFDKLIARKTWDVFVSYRRLDTSGAVQFLKVCGLIPEDVTGSLESLVKYFDIKIDNSSMHTAVGDVLAITEILKKLTELVDKNKSDKVVKSKSVLWLETPPN